MIPATRFIETSDNRDAWLRAREGGVTATEVAHASTPAGFRQAVEDRRNPVEVVANDYMQFGTDNEAWILRTLKVEFGIMPNHWLIAAADNPLHLATPDGLSIDHTVMAEVKTGGKEPTKPPLMHMRQMGWQFRCNEFAKAIVYAFMLREERNGVMVPAWMEPKIWVVERDEQMIAELTKTADLLLTDYEEWKDVA